MSAGNPLDGITSEQEREIQRLLSTIHARVMAQLAQRPDLTPGQLGALQREIEGLIGEFEERFRVRMNGALERTFDAADDAAFAALQSSPAGTIGFSTSGISRQTLVVAQQFTASQITGLMDEARRRIRSELQLAALGGRDFSELTKNIGQNLSDPSVFGSIRSRSEVIARTSISQMWNWSTQARGTQVAGRLPGLRKTWLHSTGRPGLGIPGAYQPRPGHIALHETTIPWEDNFSVNGIRAPGPHDPRLPAREVINCKCRIVMDTSQLEDRLLRV